MTRVGLWRARTSPRGSGQPVPVTEDAWRAVARRQAGLITRAQLNAVGVDRWAVRHRVTTERWVELTPTVIGTTTGELSRRQLMWLGVLHAGGDALIGELAAAELAGLRNWHRDHVAVLVPRGADLGAGAPGVEFVQTRRALRLLRRSSSTLPVARLEPAVLLFAARQRSTRTAEGVLAAVVQQQLTTPDAMLDWVEQLQPLRWAGRFRRTLREIAGGAHSVAELDVRRMCRAYGLALPRRQVKRRDSSGRVRFTDCEWVLADGRILVLEVDGSFHLDVEQWEDDLSRQRALSGTNRIIVRCTSRELRDDAGSVARDLLELGVPRAA